jgi:hypothetical protein
MPPFPDGRPQQFRATVHGIAFADRERHLDRVEEGDTMVIIADPPGGRDPGVWVHHQDGAPIGHLPPEIASWLWPWLHGGGGARARALRVHGAEQPSWRRFVVEVECAV